MTSSAPFRTVVDVRKSPSQIGHRHRILCIGSCFAEDIGEKLAEYHFNACINPTGILFNPSSIAAALSRLAKKEGYREADLFFSDGVWRSWDHHSSFCAASKEECLAKINASLSEGIEAFGACDVLILTFGTAYVYCLSSDKRIVANCHKQPAGMFTRRLLSIEELVGQYKEFFRRLYGARPECLCIATVSPVRHLRDNPHENLVSKSTLVCGLHELEKAYPRLYYFPAYEIMMDELRDYRFYEKDMTHPNDIAVEYIWEKFVEACGSERSGKFIGEYEPIRNAMDHRMLQMSIEETNKFAQTQLATIMEIEHAYPEVAFHVEKKHFEKMFR